MMISVVYFNWLNVSTDSVWLFEMKLLVGIIWSVWGDPTRKDLRAVAAKDRAGWRSCVPTRVLTPICGSTAVNWTPHGINGYATPTRKKVARGRNIAGLLASALERSTHGLAGLKFNVAGCKGFYFFQRWLGSNSEWGWAAFIKKDFHFLTR